MNDNPNQTNQLSFTQFFEKTVEAFLDPKFINQKGAIENQLNEWRSNLSFIHPLIECIQTTKFSRSLFFASLCIKFMLERYKDDIELHLIQDIFTGITYRLHHLYEKNDVNENDISAEFYSSRVNLIKCISLIQIYFPEFIEEWHNFSPNDSKILFCFLFEEEERQLPDPENVFMQKIANLTVDNIKKVLKESEMSAEWLDLFKYALEKAQKIKVYSEFLPRLAVVPNDPKLYPKFINVFQECISNDYAFLSKKSADFLERICDVCLDLIKVLISPPLDQLSIQMASFLWKEIIDYDYEFLLDHYSTFGEKAVDFLADSLRSIGHDDEEFFTLVSSVSETFNNLVENKPAIFCKPVFKFLLVLIEAINNNPAKYIVNVLASPFHEVSQNSQVPQIQQFYNDILKTSDVNGFQIISPGGIFALASSSDQIKAQYSLKVSENVLENYERLPIQAVLYFIGECCNFCGPRIQELVDIVFLSLGQENDEETTKSIVQLSRYCPQLIVEQADLRFAKILQTATNFNINNINIIVNTIQALLFIMDFLTDKHEFYNQAANAIHQTILDRVTHFYDSEEICNISLQLIIQYAKMVNMSLTEFKNVPMMTEFLINFCSRIIETINFNNIFYSFDQTTDDDQTPNSNQDPNKKPQNFGSFVHEQMCEYISLSLDSGLIDDKNYIINWIGESLTQNPVTAHIELLSKLSELFPTEQTLNFVLNVGQSNDNDLMFYTLKFVKSLAQQSWQPFFSTFSPNYFFGPLRSLDTRIVDCALETISAIIDLECEQKSLFFTSNHYDVMSQVTEGVFTNFQDIEIRKSINIWIKLFEINFIPPQAVLEYVLAKIPEKSAEFHSFTTALTPPEFMFDRDQILRATNSLKATLKP